MRVYFEDVVLLDIRLGKDGWFFSGEGHSAKEDPIHGFKTIKEIYHHADPDYDLRYTIPVLFDKKLDTIGEISNYIFESVLSI